MTALLELKQKIKNLYGQYEIYILPLLRFVLALVYFLWINTNMGYMTQLDNIFIVLTQQVQEKYFNFFWRGCVKPPDNFRR